MVGRDCKRQPKLNSLDPLPAPIRQGHRWFGSDYPLLVTSAPDKRLAVLPRSAPSQVSPALMTLLNDEYDTLLANKAGNDKRTGKGHVHVNGLGFRAGSTAMREERTYVG